MNVIHLTIKVNKMDMKNVIKIGLWLMCFVCLYNIFTTHDTTIFAVSGFVGIIFTWILLSWND
jgi:hypothetical protein